MKYSFLIPMVPVLAVLDLGPPYLAGSGGIVGLRQTTLMRRA